MGAARAVDFERHMENGKVLSRAISQLNEVIN